MWCFFFSFFMGEGFKGRRGRYGTLDFVHERKRSTFELHAQTLNCCFNIDTWLFPAGSFMSKSGGGGLAFTKQKHCKCNRPLIFKIKFQNSVCVSGMEYIHMRCLERQEDPGKLVLQVAVSLLTWVLRPKLEFSAREVYSTLSTTEPSLWPPWMNTIRKTTTYSCRFIQP